MLDPGYHHGSKYQFSDQSQEVKIKPIDWQRAAMELSGHLMAIEAHIKHEGCSEEIKSHVTIALTKYNIITQQEMFVFNNDIESVQL